VTTNKPSRTVNERLHAFNQLSRTFNQPSQKLMILLDQPASQLKTQRTFTQCQSTNLHMQSTNSQFNNPAQPINQSTGNSAHEHHNQLTKWWNQVTTRHNQLQISMQRISWPLTSLGHTMSQWVRRLNQPDQLMIIEINEMNRRFRFSNWSAHGAQWKKNRVIIPVIVQR